MSFQIRQGAVLLLISLVVTSGLSAAPAPTTTIETLLVAADEAYAARDLAAARELLQLAIASRQLPPRSDISAKTHFRIACVEALLGNRTQAMTALKAAHAAGFTDLQSYTHHPDLASLRTLREFEVLVGLIAADLDRKAHVRADRERLQPRALAWDERAAGPAFDLVFDEAGDARLAALQEIVEHVVRPDASEDDTVVALAAWSSTLWRHSGSRRASSTDPLTIIREAEAGGTFNCSDYAAVVAGAARARGFYARQVTAYPRDVERIAEFHSVAEVWLPTQQKWVLADGQFGIVPDLDGVPLNAVELQKALATGASVGCRGNAERCEEWKQFVRVNMHYLTVARDQRLGAGASVQLVLVPSGSPKPQSFPGVLARGFSNSLYTSNPAAFNAEPRPQRAAHLESPDVAR